jgi:hypothetical protein
VRLSESWVRLKISNSASPARVCASSRTITV